MNIRPAQNSDFPAVMSIIRNTQEEFRQAGIDQWQNNYPNLDSLAIDLAANTAFVLEENGLILGYFSLSFTPDKNYEQINEGTWGSNSPYGVIHRLVVASSSRLRGAALFILAFAQQTAQRNGVFALRADTHEENHPMQKLLAKHGFKYRGIVYLDGRRKRLAFEKIFSSATH